MTKITKAEFDALPESLKSKFIADGDGYQLQEEDVEGLKKSKADILKEKKDLQDKYEELAKFKAEADKAAADAKQKDLEAKGEYEKAQKERDKAWEERLKAASDENASILSTLHRERLSSELTARGVLPDRVSYLAGELLAQTEFKRTDDGFAITKKGGIGDADEFNSMIEAAKQKTPFFFGSTTQTGGGASGSGNNSGNANTITRAQYDASPHQYGAQLAKGELAVVD